MSEIEEKITELQFLEQNLQNFLMQKQDMQIELNEIDRAIIETEKTNDDVYKMVGGIIIKAEKNLLLEELQEKKKIQELKLESLKKQENFLLEKVKKLRSEITGNISKKDEGTKR